MSEPGLSADVTLDIQAALAQVEALGNDLAAAVTDLTVTADATGVTTAVDDAVAAADGTVPIDADTSEAVAALDAVAAEADGLTADIPITGDNSAALSAVEEVAAEAANQDATIEVDADTSAADAAISDLGSTVDTTGASVGGLTDHLGGFSAAGEGATGIASGLGASLGNISPQAATAVAGLGIFIGITKSFFDQAVDAEQSLIRFNTTIGKFAGDVRNINVGTLNDDLGTLALKLGTSDEALQDAASRIFALGDSSGVAGPQVAATADQILALSLNARALNPALGESGQIAEGLTGALARGGKPLVQYGIALTAAQINARALSDTGKTAAADLTVYEKAAAGAALATDQLGASFAKNIGDAGDNPAIRLAILKNNFQELQEKIGAPLVSPVLDTLEQLEPAAEQAATALGGILNAALPLIDLLSHLLGPALLIAGKAVEAFLLPFKPLAAGLDAITGLFSRESGAEKFAKEVEEATDALRDADGQVRITTDGIAKYIETKSRFDSANQTDDLDRLGLSFQEVAKFAQGGAEGQRKFTAAIEAGSESKNNIGDLQHSFRDLKETVDGAAVAAIKEAEATGAVTEKQAKAALAADDHTASLGRLQAKIDDHNAAVATATALYGPLIAQIDASGTALLGLGVESESAKAAVIDLGKGGVAPTDADLLKFAQTLDGAALSSDGMDQAAAALGITTDQLSGFVDGATQALDSFVQTAVAGLPTVGDAFRDAGNVSDFVANLSKSTAATEQFMADLKAITAAGGQDIAAELARQGVEGGGAYARELAASIAPGGKSPLVTTTEAAVDQHNAEIEKATQYLTETFGPKYIASTGLIANLAAEAFGGNLTFAQKTNLAAGLASSTLDDQGKAIAVIAANKGAAAAQAYANLFDIPAKTVAAGIKAAEAITNAPIEGAARTKGQAVGTAFTDGLAAGVSAGTKKVADQVVATVGFAAGAAKKKAESKSPSKLFARIGADFMRGMALGVDQTGDDVVSAAERIVADAAAATAGLSAAFNVQDAQTQIAAAVDAGQTLLNAVAPAAADATAAGTNVVFDFTGQVLPPGTTPADAAAITAAQVQSAVDALRRNRAVVAAVKLQGQGR